MSHRHVCPHLLTAALLAAMGVDAVAVKANPAKGDARRAPYDVIVIDGAIDAFPAELGTQLAEGGRVVTGLLERGVTRLARGQKVGGKLGFVTLADMEMVRVQGLEAEKAGFVF